MRLRKMGSLAGDFSKGKVSTAIVRLGLPIMLAELVHVFYNIVDRMYIGHMEQGGSIALTGLGVCFPLITLITAFANLCSTGGATLSAIARGEGDNAKAELIMSTAFTTCISFEDRKRLTVSTSDVQRCTKSPVSAFTW